MSSGARVRSTPLWLSSLKERKASRAARVLVRVVVALPILNGGTALLSPT
jgi:hypothetical protein